MIHVLQSLRTGATELAQVPVPLVSPNTMLVETVASVISPGTERMLLEFGRAGWIERARSQPERVRQVLDKARSDGVAASIDAVRARLETPLPLGYCQAGLVREVGDHLRGFAVGDRVATNGPHAEYVRVPATLAAKIPDGVSFEAAAFAPLAAIALQGLRLAHPTIGETVVVYGLGLIGLLSVQLARAAGCQVIGIERSEDRCEMGRRFGAQVIHAGPGLDVVDDVMQLTREVGADIVLLTLATDSDDPVRHAAQMSRKRGRIVLVGVTGLQLRRDDFYRKELSFQVSCSYGPGRYDPAHEERGVDYPLPYVRWTEARNFAAVLDLMADGRVDPLPLVTHRYEISDAASAYDLIGNGTDSLGVVLTYPAKTADAFRDGRVLARSALPESRESAGHIGVIGAGGFASRVLLPAFRDAGAVLATVAAPSGLSAAVAGERLGAARIASDPVAVLDDPAVDTVVVATRHDSHAEWTLRALRSGKHVFVEKPLALTLEDVERVDAAARESGGLLCVGFNRRFAPHSVAARDALADRVGPLVVSITVNAGTFPRDNWTRDPVAGGGRIIGEACHFIDLCRFFVGAEFRSLQVVTARGASGEIQEDVALVQLGFADGSLATVQYFTGGSRSFPKERVELFFDGKALRIDNFRRLRAWGIAGVASRWPGRQDKGHAALARAFLGAVRGGARSPIPLDELIDVSSVSVHAARLAMQGGGSLTLGGSGEQPHRNA